MNNENDFRLKKYKSIGQEITMRSSTENTEHTYFDNKYPINKAIFKAKLSFKIHKDQDLKSAKNKLNNRSVLSFLDCNKKNEIKSLPQQQNPSPKNNQKFFIKRQIPSSIIGTENADIDSSSITPVSIKSRQKPKSFLSKNSSLKKWESRILSPNIKSQKNMPKEMIEIEKFINNHMPTLASCPVLNIEKDEIRIVRQVPKSISSPKTTISFPSISETIDTTNEASQTITLPTNTVTDPSTSSTITETKNTSSGDDDDKITVTREIHRSSSSGEPVVHKVKAKIVTSIVPKNMRTTMHNCVLYILSQVLAIMLLISLYSLIIQYFGGFPQEMTPKTLNYHPIFMISSLVVLLANSIMMVTFKQMTNICRLPLIITVLVMLCVAIYVVIVWHSKGVDYHIQTMHSWFGVLTIITFLIYLIGNIHLYTSHKPNRKRELQRYMNKISKSIRNVRIVGLTCLISAMVTSLLGMNQYEDIIHINRKPNNDFNNPSSSQFMINTTAIFLIIYVAFMSFLIARQSYRPYESIEYENQVNMAVNNALKQMENNGAFDSKRSSIKSSASNSLSPIEMITSITKKSGHHSNRRINRKTRSRRSRRISITNSLRSP